MKALIQTKVLLTVETATKRKDAHPDTGNAALQHQTPQMFRDTPKQNKHKLEPE